MDRFIHHYFDIKLDAQLRATAAADGSVGLAGLVFCRVLGRRLPAHPAPGGGMALLDVNPVISLLDPERVARWLGQLLAYAWLDATDRYRIRAVGLHVARHGVLATWPLGHYVAAPLDGLPTAAASAPQVEVGVAVPQGDARRLEPTRRDHVIDPARGRHPCRVGPVQQERRRCRVAARRGRTVSVLIAGMIARRAGSNGSPIRSRNGSLPTSPAGELGTPASMHPAASSCPTASDTSSLSKYAARPNPSRRAPSETSSSR